MALFNARSVGTPEKRTEMSKFIFAIDTDLLFLIEACLRLRGDKAKCVDLAPIGYAIKSLPRPFPGGGLAAIFRDSLSTCLTSSTTFTFDHSSCEQVQVSLTYSTKQFTSSVVSPAT